MATTLYHVCRGEWDGSDLLSLSRMMQWGDEAAEYIAANWPDCDPWVYYCTEGRYIHCHETLDQAREFAAEFGGQVVEIDASELEVGIGAEYPHPVVECSIPAEYIKAT